MATIGISLPKFFAPGMTREREVIHIRPEQREFSVFVNCGDIGFVESVSDGGVILTVKQLKIFRERDGLKGMAVTRQEDGRYLVNLDK